MADFDEMRAAIDRATAHASYQELRNYAIDLANRVKLKYEWETRHPDHGTVAYMRDTREFDETGQFWMPSGASTFDPNDPMPHTNDVLTVQRFIDLMLVTLAAYEEATR